MEALTGAKTKNHRRALYIKVQKVWSSVKRRRLKRTKSWSNLTGASSRLVPYCTIQPKKLCSLIKGL